jgi:hypothetical protein
MIRMSEVEDHLYDGLSDTLKAAMKPCGIRGCPRVGSRIVDVAFDDTEAWPHHLREVWIQVCRTHHVAIVEAC